MTVIFPPHSSASISITGRCDCRAIPGSGPFTVGCNCSGLCTWALLHPLNELSPSLIWNYIKVNHNRLTGSAGLLPKDNPLQMADYLFKIITRNIWSGLLCQKWYNLISLPCDWITLRKDGDRCPSSSCFNGSELALKAAAGHWNFLITVL